jgi:hypothetical protein
MDIFEKLNKEVTRDAILEYVLNIKFPHIGTARPVLIPCRLNWLGVDSYTSFFYYKSLYDGEKHRIIYAEINGGSKTIEGTTPADCMNQFAGILYAAHDQYIADYWEKLEIWVRSLGFTTEKQKTETPSDYELKNLSDFNKFFDKLFMKRSTEANAGDLFEFRYKDLPPRSARVRKQISGYGFELWKNGKWIKTLCGSSYEALREWVAEYIEGENNKHELQKSIEKTVTPDIEAQKKLNEEYLIELIANLKICAIEPVKLIYGKSKIKNIIIWSQDRKYYTSACNERMEAIDKVSNKNYFTAKYGLFKFLVDSIKYETD